MTFRQQAATGMLTVLRLVVGVIMAAHGWQKLTGFSEWRGQAEAMGLPAPDILAPLAVAGEFAGGIGLIVGLLTPLAAVGVASVMLTAIIKVHLPHGLFAANNGFEYPLTILAVALFFLVRGAGPVSLDALLKRGVQGRRERTGYERAGERPAAEEERRLGGPGRRPAESGT